MSLTRYAWLSVAAALATIGLKTAAYFATGSVGLLSDAVESIVNLVGAVMALAMLKIAERPPDSDHAYGHGKAEYFSSGVEGTLILIAAIAIAAAAAPRLLNPQPLEHVGLGLAISTGASAINLAVGLLLLRVGRQRQSITLESNASHLLTDVWTSVAVIVGVAAVGLTGWQRLDPLVALLVAANIAYTGANIIRRSIGGLMDAALNPADLAQVQAVLDRHASNAVHFHALRTRQAGARRFVSFHVLVPGSWTFHHGHELLETIESDIRAALPETTVFTHLESADDPASFADIDLARPEPPPKPPR
jgi:cation diffusion facilitator family transporter